MTQDEFDKITQLVEQRKRHEDTKRLLDYALKKLGTVSDKVTITICSAHLAVSTTRAGKFVDELMEELDFAIGIINADIAKLGLDESVSNPHTKQEVENGDKITKRGRSGGS